VGGGAGGWRPHTARGAALGGGGGGGGGNVRGSAPTLSHGSNHNHNLVPPNYSSLRGAMEEISKQKHLVRLSDDGSGSLRSTGGGGGYGGGYPEDAEASAVSAALSRQYHRTQAQGWDGLHNARHVVHHV